jgi:hypothetical protein
MIIYKLVCANKFHANNRGPIGVLGLYSTEAIAMDALIGKVLSRILDLKKLFSSSTDITFPQTHNKILIEKVIDFDFVYGFADYDPDLYTVKIETKQRKIFDDAVKNIVKTLTVQNLTANCINEAIANFLQTDFHFEQNGMDLKFYLGNYVVLNRVYKVMGDYFFNSIWSTEEIQMDEMLPETNVEALKELEILLLSNEHEKQW